MNRISLIIVYRDKKGLDQFDSRLVFKYQLKYIGNLKISISNVMQLKHLQFSINRISKLNPKFIRPFIMLINDIDASFYC